MKQFNLEEYLKNPERKVVTRDGKPVRIICTDRKPVKDEDVQPIIALVYNADDEGEWCYIFYPNGEFLYGEGHNLDLFFAPTKHEGWINVYRNERTCYVGGGVYETEQVAKEMAGEDKDRVATIKIEWEG